MTVWRIAGDGALARHDEAAAEPGDGEVRIAIRAVSLNYRDLLMLDNPAAVGRVPLSDGAGLVEAIGAGVSNLRPGDRVMIPFFREWLDGPYRRSYMASALGGPTVDGVLADTIVVPAEGPVPIPHALSFEEAATLPCAAVTVWSGLIARAAISAGDTLLVQGTGGVALFALQLARARGARVIVISSSDEKLDRARAIGAAVAINYRTTPDWEQEVLKATDGEGVSHVLELGGPDTYQRSLDSLASGGKIVQVGVLTGFAPRPALGGLQFRNADIIGVTVGSRAHLAAVASFIADRGIRPVIDRAFPVQDAPAAFAHLRAAGHVGKVVLAREIAETSSY